MEYTNYRGPCELLRTAGSGFDHLEQLRGDEKHAGGCAGDGRDDRPQPPSLPTAPGRSDSRGSAGTWSRRGTESATGIRTIAWWHGLLCKGARGLVGGSDFHRHEPLRTVGDALDVCVRCVPLRGRHRGSPACRQVLHRLLEERTPPGPPCRRKGVRREHDPARAGGGHGDGPRGEGDRVRLLDGRGNVKEWQVPFDGEHATRFAASPDEMFYRLEVRRTLTSTVKLLAWRSPTPCSSTLPDLRLAHAPGWTAQPARCARSIFVNDRIPIIQNVLHP